MMHEFLKYPDGTEVVFSSIRHDENGEEVIWVCFERPMEHGFDTVIFELPSYRIVRKEGNYTDEEIEKFLKTVEDGADIFFKYAREEGMNIV